MIPFAKADIGVKEVSAVMQVLESGWLISGDWMRNLEAAVSGYLGGVNAIAVNSATSGLHLALEAMGIVPGDEVPAACHPTGKRRVVELGARIENRDENASTAAHELGCVESD